MIFLSRTTVIQDIASRLCQEFPKIRNNHFIPNALTFALHIPPHTFMPDTDLSNL